MKRMFLAFVPLLLLTVSCTRKSSGGTTGVTEDTGSVKIPLVFAVDTFHVADTEKQCPENDCASADVYYELIRQPGNAAQDSVNAYARAQVDRFFEYEMGGGPHASADVKKAVGDFLAAYREYRESDDIGGPWSAEFHLSIAHPYTELYTIHSGGWTYTGGAHGNGYTRYTLFSAATGRVLALEDMFTDIKKLTAITETYFRQQNMDDPNMDLTEYGFEFGDDGFHLNDNFMLGPGGLTFVYNPYEVAPYAAGSLEVTVPFEKISGLLKIKLTEVK